MRQSWRYQIPPNPMGNRISPRRHKSSVHPSYITVPDVCNSDDDEDTLIATRSMTTPRPTEPMAIVSQRCHSDRQVAPSSRPGKQSPSPLSSVVDTTSLGMSYPPAMGNPPPLERKERAAIRQQLRNRLTPESQQSPFWKCSLAESQTPVY